MFMFVASGSSLCKTDTPGPDKNSRSGQVAVRTIGTQPQPRPGASCWSVQSSIQCSCGSRTSDTRVEVPAASH